MTARSYLYVPGDRPEMLAKAQTRGADALIIDLEDAVAEARKDEARRIVAEWLQSRSQGDSEIWLRINSHRVLSSEDLRLLESGGRVRGVMVPKASQADVDTVTARLAPTQGIVALIETAGGLLEAPAIASRDRVVRLALGEADLVADLGITPSPDRHELVSLRLRVVVASAAAGIEGPIAPVSTDVRNLMAVERSTRDLMRLGFTARSAVHPDQLEVINQVFTPTADEIAEARAMVDAAEGAEAAGSGVFLDESGHVIDEAVVRSARRVLARAADRSTPGSTLRNTDR